MKFVKDIIFCLYLVAKMYYTTLSFMDRVGVAFMPGVAYDNLVAINLLNYFLAALCFWYEILYANFPKSLI